jgi:hypothetical protein
LIRERSARRVAALAALIASATLGGCGDDDAAEEGRTAAREATSTLPGSPGAPDDSAPGSLPPTSGAGPGGTASAPPGAPRPTAPPPTPSPTTSPSPAPAPAGVGAFAPFYLRPAESARIVLEVRSQRGAEPREGSVSHLRSVLGANSGKDVAVAGGSVDGGARAWTADQIRAEADRSGMAQSRGAAVIRILYLRGSFAESDTVLGLAVRSDVAAIFSDKVDEAAGLVGDPARIEDAVTVHEAGHLLGLVDLFLDTGRADPDHPGHSPNRGSVMYYAVESTLVGSILDGGPPTELDAADRADLAAIRRG